MFVTSVEDMGSAVKSVLVEDGSLQSCGACRWQKPSPLGDFPLTRMWRSWNPIHCWWEGEMVEPVWKVAWLLLGMLDVRLPCDPVIPPLGADLRLAHRC